jgi:hypothetical protein
MDARAHLAVGTWHVHEHGPERGPRASPHGITRLNEAHGTVNASRRLPRDDHTRVRVPAVGLHPHARLELAVADCVQAVLAGSLAGKKALLRYYSKETCCRVREGWSSRTASRFL